MGKPEIPEREHVQQGLMEWGEDLEERLTGPNEPSLILESAGVTDNPPDNAVQVFGAIKGEKISDNLGYLVKRALDIGSGLFGPYLRKDRQRVRQQILDVHNSERGINANTILGLAVHMQYGIDYPGFLRLDYKDIHQTLFLENKVIDFLLKGLGEDIDLIDPSKANILLSHSPMITYHSLFDGRVSVATYNENHDGKQEWQDTGLTCMEVFDFVRCHLTKQIPKGYYPVFDRDTKQKYFVQGQIMKYLRDNFGEEVDVYDPMRLRDNPNIVCTELLQGRLVVATLHKIFSGREPSENLKHSEYRPEDSSHFHEHDA